MVKIGGSIDSILAGMKPPEVCLLWKKRCVGGRRSAAGGRRGQSALGGRISAVGGRVGQSALGGRRWCTCGGESSLGAERSRPKRQNVAVGDLLSESSVFSRLETRRINWVIFKIFNKSHKFF